MKRLKTTLGIAGLLVATLISTSCKNTNEEGAHEGGDHSKINHETMDASEMNTDEESTATEVIVNGYLQLKDALVADNTKAAAEAGKQLAVAFEEFDTTDFDAEQQQELNEIIEDAHEHAEHIAESDIAHQREHFEILSQDIADMVAITGAAKTLYQQYCPMYNNNKGGMWLSANKEIKNPYFGAQMLNCGEVQKEI